MKRTYKIIITTDGPEAESVVESWMSEEFRIIEEACGNVEGLSLDVFEPEDFKESKS